MSDSFSPTLSVAEKNRRYALLRAYLQKKGIDCAIVTGSNLFYLSNGLPGERYGLFTATETPLTVVLNRRHLIDVSPQVLLEAQDWVQDIRAGHDAGPLFDRIRELHLDRGTIGLTDVQAGYQGVSYGFYVQLQRELPAAAIVDVTDVFDDLRTVKSEEEIAMVEKANRAFDAAIGRVHAVARPAMLGREVIHEGVRAMWEAGGDLESTFHFNFGAVPAQNPILARLCLDRRIQAGDMGTLTAHAYYGGYAGHSDQEISFGAPKPLHLEMFKAICYVRDQVLKKVRGGATQQDLVAAYEKACGDTDYRASAHSQIHQYGIDVPEFPGPSYAVREKRIEEGEGGKGRSSRIDFVLQAGMIYSISPTLLASDGGDTMLAGTSLVVTESGYRELGERKIELLIAH